METVIEYYRSLAGMSDAISVLVQQGGPVIPAIIAASLLLWFMIIERYWFITFEYPPLVSRIAGEWNTRSDRESWYARRIREGLISQLSLTLRRRLLQIQALVAILPLLGLLGTVTGMIATFDILNSTGSNDIRGLSGGISKALLPTTAGLVTAIAGLFFSINLKHRAETEINRVTDKLV